MIRHALYGATGTGSQEDPDGLQAAANQTGPGDELICHPSIVRGPINLVRSGGKYTMKPGVMCQPGYYKHDFFINKGRSDIQLHGLQGDHLGEFVQFGYNKGDVGNNILVDGAEVSYSNHIFLIAGDLFDIHLKNISSFMSLNGIRLRYGAHHIHIENFVSDRAESRIQNKTFDGAPTKPDYPNGDHLITDRTNHDIKGKNWRLKRAWDAGFDIKGYNVFVENILVEESCIGCKTWGKNSKFKDVTVINPKNISGHPIKKLIGIRCNGGDATYYDVKMEGNFDAHFHADGGLLTIKGHNVTNPKVEEENGGKVIFVNDPIEVKPDPLPPVAQIKLTAIGGGYYRVYVGEVEHSKHTAEREAIEVAVGLASQEIPEKITYRHDYVVEVK